MTIDTKDMLNSILSSISRIDYVRPDDIPNIDLYMDQVTTFMEKELASSKRHEDDKILTKTMINNYAKNNLLPPPVKKKYSKEHLLIMIFIYYFKNFLSIKDIETMLEPITDKYFDTDQDFDITSIYKEVCELEKSRIPEFEKEIIRSYNSSKKCFDEAPEDDRDSLQLFAFICNLSFDIYVKKQIVEKLLDNFPDLLHSENTGVKKDSAKKEIRPHVLFLFLFLHSYQMHLHCFSHFILLFRL